MYRRNVILLIAGIITPWVLLLLTLIWAGLISWFTFVATALVSVVGGILIGGMLGPSDD